eukprot:5112297-Pleurochrysis_carterae.AAC.1
MGTMPSLLLEEAGTPLLPRSEVVRGVTQQRESKAAESGTALRAVGRGLKVGKRRGFAAGWSIKVEGGGGRKLACKRVCRKCRHALRAREGACMSTYTWCMSTYT